MKPRIIVLEGIRGSGKSLMAVRLDNVLTGFGYRAGVAKWSRGEKPWEDMAEQLKYAQEDLVESGNFVIIDRFHFTEAVMRVADKTEQYLDMLIKAVEMQFAIEAIGGITFWLNLPPSLAIERVKARNDGRGLESPEVPFIWDNMMLAVLNSINGPTSIKEINAGRNEVEVLEKLVKELMG